MPVGRPQVSIRLGTTGRSDVEKDFAAIGDAGEAQARRYQASWERASAEADAAVQRAARAAERLNAVGATPIQQQINAATGVGTAQTGTAKAAAQALAQQLSQAEAEARQLISAIDPLFAAQARYESQIERINAVRATGQLDEQRYQQLLAHEKTLLDEATAAAGRNTASRGTMRMGMQQLSFQIGDISQQLALGVRGSVIFAQQSGQVIQALQLMGGQGNAFLKFLGGPWGIALSAAAVVLTPLIGKLLDTGSAVDGLVDKLKKEARQSADNDQAHRVFASTLEGVIDATRRNEEALKKMSDQGKSAAEQALANAASALEHAKALRTETDELLKNAQAQLARDQAMLTGITSPEGREFAMQNMAAAQAAVADLQAKLAQTDGEIAKNQRDLADATTRLTVELVTRDPVERIRQHYKDLIEQTRQRLFNEHQTLDVIARQTLELQRQSDAAVKAYEDSHRKGPANAGGTAIFNDQIGAFFDIASRYRGLSETKDRLTLKSFLGNVDPEKTAWCAAFVNAVLAAGGVHGTGSLAASSFLNFGKDDTRSPQRGDIVVVKSSASPSGEHVGFLDSIDAKGNVRVLGGNTGNRVGTLAASAKDVLAIRRPPTPSEAAAADDKAASAAQQAQDAFDTERARLNQQLLQEIGKVAVGYEAQATVQQRIAQAEHDAEATAIANNLAQGKYGDATSALAKTRAQQLAQANDDLLQQRQAAIAFEAHVKFLQGQDAANERDARFQVDALQFQESMARTAADRRRLQLEIIAVEYQEKERHLQYLLALDQLLGRTQDAADAAAQLANLPAERARAEAGAIHGTQGPLASYLDSLPRSADELNEALQRVEAQGLQSFVDIIGQAGNGWKAMRDTAIRALQDIESQLLRLGAQRLLGMLLGTGAGALGGGAGGADLAGLAGSGLYGSAASDFGFLLGGGNATGTEYFRGGLTWVGEHGKELVRLPRGSKIMSAADSRRAEARLRPANSNAPAGDTFHIYVAPPSGSGRSASEDRRSGMQIGAGVAQALAMRSRKGLQG